MATTPPFIPRGVSYRLRPSGLHAGLDRWSTQLHAGKLRSSSSSLAASQSLDARATTDGAHMLTCMLAASFPLQQLFKPAASGFYNITDIDYVEWVRAVGSSTPPSPPVAVACGGRPTECGVPLVHLRLLQLHGSAAAAPTAAAANLLFRHPTVCVQFGINDKMRCTTSGCDECRSPTAIAPAKPRCCLVSSLFVSWR